MDPEAIPRKMAKANLRDTKLLFVSAVCPVTRASLHPSGRLALKSGV